MSDSAGRGRSSAGFAGVPIWMKFRDLFLRFPSESFQHVAVEREPAGKPVGAIAERSRRGDDVHRAGAGGQFLLPGRNLRVRPGVADDGNHQRRIHQPALLGLDVGSRRGGILLRKYPRDDVAGPHSGVALEHDEAPWRQLAVVRHPRADGQDGLEFGSGRAGAAHLARLDRAADLQEFDSVGHRGLFS